jgi:signal transduction histidine kinase
MSALNAGLAADARTNARRARWLAPSLWALSLALIALHYLFLGLSRPAPVPDAIDFEGSWVTVIFALAFSSVGALVASRRPGNSIGWVFSAVGITWAVLVFAPAYAAYVFLAGHGSQSLGDVTLWLQNWVWFPAVGLTGTFALLLFPDGRLPSPRWRPVAWGAAVGIPVASLAASLEPGAVENFGLDNPFALEGAAWTVASALAVVGGAAVVASFVASAVSLIVRFRRARGEQRQQLKWFAYAAALTGVAFPTAFALWDVSEDGAGLVMALAITALPIGAGIAILRYRLYDIDLLINRTLVYGVLTASIVGVYAGTIAFASLAFRERAGVWASVVATGIVLVLVQPLRGWLQRRVNRLMYGDRDDPYAAISRLGQRLQATVAPDALLPAVVETVAQALRLPHAAIEVEHDGSFEPVAKYGRPRGGEPLRLPLVHQGQTIGRLVLAPRAPGEAFGHQDRRLLDDLARQISVAAHAFRLTAELQRSRERLVTAREEERRRIRRDLHDGLGPTLAGLALKLEAVRRLLASDSRAAEDVLLELQRESQAAIADIRRLVYELRPPALDELGLVGALREQATRIGSRKSATTESAGWDGLLVLVEAPVELPPLPAAVEVAAYRIALEALTNVARHAGADTCTVRLTVNGTLELEIADDGKGIPSDPRSGVGLTSMRERAEEIGGTCTIELRPDGGTRVRASLPVHTD